MVDVTAGAAVTASELLFEFEAGGFRLQTPALQIESGERVACIGPSGSGKSTFLALLAGILCPQSGRIEIDGEDWSQLSDAERRTRRLERIGFVFQEFELLEHLPVRENILLPSWLTRARPNARELEMLVSGLAESAGISELMKRSPSQLSQGERQRVAVCRALAQRPALVVADEPTGNLDRESSSAVRELLFSEARDRGTTLVVVTHDSGFAAEFDRVLDFGEFAS